jgi:hypothetical protein
MVYLICSVVSTAPSTTWALGILNESSFTIMTLRSEHSSPRPKISSNAADFQEPSDRSFFIDRAGQESDGIRI